jgi:type IX secretion system PorP/SprF family membrane protein
MSKYTIILLFTLASFLSVKGQQDIIYSQYMFDKMLVNPAYAGSSKWVVGSIKNRMQFVGLEGAPITNVLTFQAPVQLKNIGLGVKVLYDKIAVTNSLAATGFFSYHLGFGSGKLSFGLEGGIFNNAYDYNSLNRVDAVDPAISSSAESVILPDVSTGVFYQTSSFYIGASAYHLLSPVNSASSLGNTDLHPLKKSFYGVGGYIFELSDKIFLEPGFLLKYAPAAPVQVDFNLCLILHQRFSIGTSFRTGDAVIGFVKIDITKNLKVFYSYDYTISHLARVSNGSHEIGISYGIELLPPPEQKVIHPRYYF